MGVYIFQSKHMDVIKIGHYHKNNAWSRIAHRGFNSVLHPIELKDKVGVNDFNLIYWFPNLSTYVEKKIQLEFETNGYKVVGEWFKLGALELIKKYNYENRFLDCNKDEALKTKRRL